ncbi:MAG: tetratricopeptide repeat protein [Pirellulales bacterium]
MSTTQSPLSDLLVTVKSREVQRGMLAEMAGDGEGAARHFLAAAHLELVLAKDYAEAGLDDLALRSRLSAASCFWRAGETSQARRHFQTALQDYPERAEETRRLITELELHLPSASLRTDGPGSG